MGTCWFVLRMLGVRGIGTVLCVLYCDCVPTIHSTQYGFMG